MSTRPDDCAYEGCRIEPAAKVYFVEPAEIVHYCEDHAEMWFHGYDKAEDIEWL